MSTEPQLCDRLLRVRGTVQGVGFRPFVHRLATELRICGWVRNDAEGILIRAAGDIVSVVELAEAIQHRAPPAARVKSLEWSQWFKSNADPAPTPTDFTIVASPRLVGEIETAAPPDLALCADCRHELTEPSDRRHAYPFITCTQCGPRYSIIERLPYDRPQTTMRYFSLCRSCQREYDDPRDRRFHAEPNACPECGPQLTLTNAKGQHLTERDAALTQTIAALCAGRIVAVKGLGGFHLMCDATNETTVAALRLRKHREEKPLAVMFRDIEALRRVAVVSPAAATLLTSPQAPIVLVPRHDGTVLASSVAPVNRARSACRP